MGGNRGARGWFKLISFLALSGPQPDSCKFEHKVLWHMFCSLWEETPWGAALQRIKVPFMPFEMNWWAFRQVTVWPLLRSSPWISVFRSGSSRDLYVLGIKLRTEIKTSLEVVNSSRCMWTRCSSLPQAMCCSLLTSTSHVPALLKEFWRALLNYLFSPNSEWWW